MTTKPKLGVTKRKASKAGRARTANQPGIRPATKTRRRPNPSQLTSLESFRHRYHLSREMFASLLGVTEATLAKWDNGGPIGSVNLTKVKRVQGLFRKLEQSMRRNYVATWLTQPSQACADLGVKTPADLFARGDYEAVEDMIFFLGSGVAF